MDHPWTLLITPVSLISAIDRACEAALEDARNKGFLSEMADEEEQEQLQASQQIALMHSELSEMLEAIRDPVASSEKIPAYTKEEEEAADLAIRLFHYCGRRKIRLGEAILYKGRYNEERPPKHGRKF